MKPRIRRYAVLALALSCLALGFAAVGSAEGDAQRLVERFAEVFSAGDADAMMAFYREHATEAFRSRRSDTDHRALYGRLLQDLGALQEVRVTAVGEDAVRLTARSARGDAVTFEFRIAPGPPPRIDGFSVDVGAAPGGPENPLPPVDVPEGAGATQVRAAVDRYLSRLAKDGVFSGVALVARGDEVLFEKGYGLANREAKIPVTPATRFDVGSITKEITKVAIGQLARKGKLDLDDRLVEHLPEYPNRAAAGKITIAELVDHRSGLGDIFNERFDATPKENLVAPRDFFPLFASDPLQFEPGTDRSYSNAGYVVLGAVVEAVSGMPYADYITKHVFALAGMKDSGFPARDGSRKEIAIGYTRPDGGDEPRRNLGMLPLRGCPAGSSSHTARDLLRFDEAVRSGRLLGPGWTEWLFTGVVPSDDAARGPFRGPVENPIGIAGGAPGVNAVLESGEGMAFIVLANLDPPIAGHVVARLREAFR